MATKQRDVDWQCHKSLPECTLHLLEQQVACDVTFLVGPEGGERKEIPAHKLILLARSPVFQAMFCGMFSETSDSEINIPDIEPEVFMQMLRYFLIKIPTTNIITIISILFYLISRNIISITKMVYGNRIP